MKKIFFAVLAIAAMMVSCQKEALVDNQKETPEVEVNEPQPVILGSNLFKAPTTKASIDNMLSWLSDMKNNEDVIDKFIYVWALNGKENATGDEYTLIRNLPATLEENGIGEFTRSLDLKENDKPIYYKSNDYDRYNFYSYYLGYKLDNTEEVNTEAVCVDNVIEVRDVEIRGYNDIMIASTDKAADAIVDGTMVNPKYLYSEYSARHHVRPNLVFKHQLSKFSFNVRYDGELAENDEIYLKKITFEDEKKTGRLVLNKVEGGDEPGLYIAAQENQGDVFNEFDLQLEKANEYAEQKYGYNPAGNLMVVPAGENSYKLKIDLKQTFNEDGTEYREYDNQVEITKAMVVTDDGSEVPGFEAGKHYVVNITVYGLQAVVVNVQLVPWEDAGIITIDPDQKEDGIMQQVNATLAGDEGRACTLYAEEFTEGKDIWCVFTGEDDPEKGKLVSAPDGIYTVTGTEGDLPDGATITVSDGKIVAVEGTPESV